ncbi:MAG: hypothetical protein KA109_12130 [Saprospiraceae bacterium]|jgi:hypothetical protein|nr:hypothetical protein [Saprospiraceae bacterium]MBK6479110.1 hypothetical protein [Saprospiraceae bacterium]MBK6817428.1 hypothetical protein [Saprospiraceae bacterium]MBK7372819.1 hypothetical protein [Saprospiraceae bacterium]MBK7439506.1 hypothetical protein [Saprospiraceae bacterium]
MKDRILKGWTFHRVIYLVLGGFVMIQSALIHQWLGVALGLYFASMGLFAFGCASGKCFEGSCDYAPTEPSSISHKHKS